MKKILSITLFLIICNLTFSQEKSDTIKIKINKDFIEKYNTFMKSENYTHLWDEVKNSNMEELSDFINDYRSVKIDSIITRNVALINKED